MSLINKMLQDLDARGNARADGVPFEVKPVAVEARRLSVRRIAAIAAALLVAALAATAWVMLPLKGKTYDAPAPVAALPVVTEPVTVAEVAPPAVASAVPVAPAPTLAPAPAATLVPAPVPVPEPAPAAPVPTAAPRDAAQPAREPTTWAVASARARAEQQRLDARWRAEEARIAVLPGGAQAAARAAARTEADAAWVAALKRKEEAAGGAPLDAPVVGERGAGARPQGRVETPSQAAENTYRRALVALQEGRTSEAIAGLQATLRAYPAHEAARQTLVSLLIESRRGDEAMVQLQQALSLDARQPALAMLLARLQIEGGKSGIDTLQRTLPYAAGNGDYHAFLAGALQRQARHAEAVEQYQAALRSAPGNAVWWMGLAISLQGDKRNGEAADAYRRAKALGTLSGELQGFVERKIEQLAR